MVNVPLEDCEGRQWLDNVVDALFQTVGMSGQQCITLVMCFVTGGLVCFI